MRHQLELRITRFKLILQKTKENTIRQISQTRRMTDRVYLLENKQSL